LRRERLKTGNRTLHRLVRLSLCRPVSFHSTTKRAAAEGFSRNKSVTIRALPTPARPGRVARRARARCLRNRSCGEAGQKKTRKFASFPAKPETLPQCPLPVQNALQDGQERACPDRVRLLHGGRVRAAVRAPVPAFFVVSPVSVRRQTK